MQELNMSTFINFRKQVKKRFYALFTILINFDVGQLNFIDM